MVARLCALRFVHISVSQVKSNIHLGVLPTACGLEYVNNDAAAILSVSDEPFMWRFSFLECNSLLFTSMYAQEMKNDQTA